MKIVKKCLSVLLCGLLCISTVALIGIATPKENAFANNGYATEKSFLDGDSTTNVKNHNIYLDYSLNSGSPSKTVSSNYSIKASQSFKSGVYTGTGGAPRVFREPTGAGLSLEDMNQDNLAFSFWLYSTEKVLLSDDSAVYLGKGDGSKNSLRITPNDGIFSKNNRYVEKGWNYFSIELGEILNGNTNKGEITLFGTAYSTDYNNGVIGVNHPVDRIDIVAKTKDNQADWYFDDFKFYDTTADGVQYVSNGLALKNAMQQSSAKTFCFNYIIEVSENLYIDRDITIDFNGYKAMGLSNEGIFTVAKNAQVTFKNASVKTAWTGVYVGEGAKVTFVGNTLFERISRTAIENYGTLDFSLATLSFDDREQNAINLGENLPSSLVTNGKACVIMLGNSSFDVVPDGYSQVEDNGVYYVYKQLQASDDITPSDVETVIAIYGLANGANIAENGEYQLNATVLRGEEISSSVVWSVSGSEKVTINQNGLLKIDKGAVGSTLTVTASANGSETSITLTVVEQEVTSSCSGAIKETSFILALTLITCALLIKSKRGINR